MDGPWWAPILAVAVTAIVMGIGKAQPYLTGQKAKEKAETAKLEEARAKLDARTLKYVEDVETRYDEVEVRFKAAEKDVGYWRGIAQRWFNSAHENRLREISWYQRYDGAMQRGGLAPLEAQVPDLPVEIEHVK